MKYSLFALGLAAALLASAAPATEEFKTAAGVLKMTPIQHGSLTLEAGGQVIEVDPAVSGCYIGGDVRGMVEVRNKAGEKLLIVAKNDDAVQVLKVNAR